MNRGKEILSKGHKKTVIVDWGLDKLNEWLSWQMNSTEISKKESKKQKTGVEKSTRDKTRGFRNTMMYWIYLIYTNNRLNIRQRKRRATRSGSVRWWRVWWFGGAWATGGWEPMDLGVGASENATRDTGCARGGWACLVRLTCFRMKMCLERMGANAWGSCDVVAVVSWQSRREA